MPKKKKVVKRKKKSSAAASEPVEKPKPMYPEIEYADPYKHSPEATLRICLSAPQHGFLSKYFEQLTLKTATTVNLCCFGFDHLFNFVSLEFLQILK